MVVGLAVLFMVAVAAVFIADLLASHSSSVTKSRQRSSGVGRRAETSITMEPLRMAAMKETNINPINGSVGNGASGSSVVFIGVVVCRLGWKCNPPTSPLLLFGHHYAAC